MKNKSGEVIIAVVAVIIYYNLFIYLLNGVEPDKNK